MPQKLLFFLVDFSKNQKKKLQIESEKVIYKEVIYDYLINLKLNRYVNINISHQDIKPNKKKLGACRNVQCLVVEILAC
jgi:hypothetical protein